jgi:trans-2,3-dihydro-3-hydroxyanthranilate isomerase
MPSHPFVLVDVFTDRPLSGNQLAVFMDAEGLDDRQMQSIAQEFGYSETTFVLPPRQKKATWRLRCFTPSIEVFGAGHNSLGAWWVLAAHGRVPLSGPQTEAWQELGVRVLPVEIESSGQKPSRVWMTQTEPVWGATVEDRAALAHVIGLEAADLDVPGLEPRAVSTGANHLLVPVRSLAALGRIRVENEGLLALARSVDCQGCYPFTLETLEPGSAAHARAFFPGVDIEEDPATGSAAGPLGAYLVSQSRVAEKTTFVVEQGDEAGRRSRIEVRVSDDTVKVGGRCAIVGEGRLEL